MIGRSLSSRLTALLQMVAVAVIVAFAGSSLWLTARTLQRGERTLLEDAARRLAADLDQEFAEEGKLDLAAAAVLGEEAASGLRIEIIDAAGKILASTSRIESTRGSRHASPADLQRVAVLAKCGATVAVSVSSKLRMATIAALGRALLLAAVPLLLLTLLASRFLIGRALRPLRQMEHQAREASFEGTVRSIGPTFGLAEIDALRDSFDHLLSRLDDLLQSERRFTSDASHELRTPLTILSGELEMALSHTDLPVDTREGLERASEQVRTMRDLVEALLLLRRSRGGQHTPLEAFEPVNLTDLSMEMVRIATMRNPSREQDLRASGPDEILVLGHATLLGSALRNLIDNAIKFTGSGQPIRVSVEAEGDDACVTVDDGGSGVPAGERTRIFDPFFRGSEARATRQGIGLGLPILRQVARAHGGEVSVGDSPLGGARFTLRLPLLRST